MTNKNPNYDFKWCPGCGDFGVRRAVELALTARNKKFETRMHDNVIVAGIGCSGNLVHLVSTDEQPYGVHGIHGRSLPIALGVKTANPNLNVLTAAGDGDFLSIGAEHIGPQAQRNINMTSIVMDNGVYGLTKGQSSPTSKVGAVTTSTPFGKIEGPVSPLSHYLELGVTFIASSYSSKPRDLAVLIEKAMEHDGFSIVHVMSPCTTFNDTYAELKGNPRLGIEPGIIEIPSDYDSSDKNQAMRMLQQPKIPIGILYQEKRSPFMDTYDNLAARVPTSDTEKILDSYLV